MRFDRSPFAIAAIIALTIERHRHGAARWFMPSPGLHEAGLALEIDTYREIPEASPRLTISLTSARDRLPLRDGRQLDDLATPISLHDHRRDVDPSKSVHRRCQTGCAKQTRASPGGRDDDPGLIKNMHWPLGLSASNCGKSSANVGLDRLQQRTHDCVQVDDLAVGGDDHHVAAYAVDVASTHAIRVAELV